jgi:hypothetical protein
MLSSTVHVTIHLPQNVGGKDFPKIMTVTHACTRPCIHAISGVMVTFDAPSSHVTSSCHGWTFLTGCPVMFSSPLVNDIVTDPFSEIMDVYDLTFM